MARSGGRRPRAHMLTCAPTRPHAAPCRTSWRPCPICSPASSNSCRAWSRSTAMSTCAAPPCARMHAPALACAAALGWRARLRWARMHALQGGCSMPAASAGAWPGPDACTARGSCGPPTRRAPHLHPMRAGPEIHRCGGRAPQPPRDRAAARGRGARPLDEQAHQRDRGRHGQRGQVGPLHRQVRARSNRVGGAAHARGRMQGGPCVQARCGRWCAQ